MSIGSRLFVALVFGILGLTFIATTAVMIHEFQYTEWFSLLVFYSHLFVFFPSFGLVALAAFFIPACVFTDMYWHHVQLGRIRFLIGFTVLVAASYGISHLLLQGEERTFWEVTPEVLTDDRGDPAGCNGEAQSCRRLPVLTTLETVRSVSRSRTGLSDFARNCSPDPFFESPSRLSERRFCFLTDTLPPNRSELRTAEECCQAQERFVSYLSEAYQAGEANHSLTGQVHNILLPFKVFFLLVLLAVGVLLAIRRRKVDEHYGYLSRRIERGVLVGAFAMLFWPVMNHAFLRSAEVIYGSFGDSTFRALGSGFSLVVGAWGMLLLFFFYRRYEKSMEAVGKIAGVIASAVAILKYDLIVDYFVRFVGSGATVTSLSVLLAICVLALIHLSHRIRRSTEIADEHSETP